MSESLLISSDLQHSIQNRTQEEIKRQILLEIFVEFNLVNLNLIFNTISC